MITSEEVLARKLVSLATERFELSRSELLGLLSSGDTAAIATVTKKLFAFEAELTYVESALATVLARRSRYQSKHGLRSSGAFAYGRTRRGLCQPETLRSLNENAQGNMSKL
jgi:hypothetical protein